MVGERGRRLLGFVRFRAVGLKLSVTAMDWASPPRGHREACARPGAVQCLSSGRSPRPACPPGAHSPCARRVGRRQPPEGVGRERERGRGLGRCRGLERGRGCGSLRRGSVSASSALLPGRRRGAAENAGSGPARFFLSGEHQPQGPNPFSTPAGPATPPRSSAPDPRPLPRHVFSGHPPITSPGPHMRPTQRTPASGVSVPTWGSPLPTCPPRSPPQVPTAGPPLGSPKAPPLSCHSHALSQSRLPGRAGSALGLGCACAPLLLLQQPRGLGGRRLPSRQGFCGRTGRDQAGEQAPDPARAGGGVYSLPIICVLCFICIKCVCSLHGLYVPIEVFIGLRCFWK